MLNGTLIGDPLDSLFRAASFKVIQAAHVSFQSENAAIINAKMRPSEMYFVTTLLPLVPRYTSAFVSLETIGDRLKKDYVLILLAPCLILFSRLEAEKNCFSAMGKPHSIHPLMVNRALRSILIIIDHREAPHSHQPGDSGI